MCRIRQINQGLGGWRLNAVKPPVVVGWGFRTASRSAREFFTLANHLSVAETMRYGFLPVLPSTVLSSKKMQPAPGPVTDCLIPSVQADKRHEERFRSSLALMPSSVTGTLTRRAGGSKVETASWPGNPNLAANRSLAVGVHLNSPPSRLRWQHGTSTMNG